jgi:hypothetical protein
MIMNSRLEGNSAHDEILHVKDMRENVGGDFELFGCPFVSRVWRLCMDLYRDMRALYNS